MGRPPKVPMTVTCAGCGIEFTRRHGEVDRKFCSLECACLNKPKKGEILTCLICGAIFYKKKSEAATAKYCSAVCHAEAQKKRVHLKCVVCGEDYERPESQVRWRGSSICSRKCVGEFLKSTRSGENSSNWQGGVSRAYKYGYHSTEYKKWHNDVFERDNFTCQLCGIKGGYLHAHHVKSFSHFPDLRFVLSNGLTLCKTCHMEVHSKQCEPSENLLMNHLQGEAMEDLKRKRSPSRTTTC